MTMRRALLLAILLTACGRSAPLTTEELTPFQSCSVDEDCILQTNGCLCESAAIARAQSDAFRDQFTCDEALPPCAPENAHAECRAAQCVKVPGS